VIFVLRHTPFRTLRSLFFITLGWLVFGWPLSSKAVIQTAIPSPQGSLPPGISFQLKAQPEKATVGDPMAVDLDLIVPAGYRVNLPEFAGRIGDFTILEFIPWTTVTPAGSETAKTQQHYRGRLIIAAYQTGLIELPPVRTTLKTPENRQIEIASSPLKIEILSILTGKDQNLKDLKKQAEIPESIPWFRWLLLTLLICLLIAIVWWYWRRRRKRASLSISAMPEIDPLDLAESELRKLKEHGFPDRAAVKQFYVALSEIVKNILSASWGIQTAEKTTLEIMEAFQEGATAAAMPQNARQIETFLAGCDLVKFAKYVPSVPEDAAALQEAFQILAEARKMKPAIAEPVNTAGAQ
jgi:cbb3-type cytochrome oxidase subunit 3